MSYIVDEALLPALLETFSPSSKKMHAAAALRGIDRQCLTIGAM